LREIRGTVKGLAGWADWPYDLVEDAELGLTEKIDNVFKSPKIVRISEN
jgi:anti-sigma regulatory factor (Ser/Thr protein kinase)